MHQLTDEQLEQLSEYSNHGVVHVKRDSGRTDLTYLLEVAPPAICWVKRKRSRGRVGKRFGRCVIIASRDVEQNMRIRGILPLNCQYLENRPMKSLALEGDKAVVEYA